MKNFMLYNAFIFTSGTNADRLTSSKHSKVRITAVGDILYMYIATFSVATVFLVNLPIAWNELYIVCIASIVIDVSLYKSYTAFLCKFRHCLMYCSPRLVICNNEMAF